MRVGGWRRATREDLPRLEAFLRGRERMAAGFVGRLLRDGALRLPNPLRGAVYVFGEDGGAVEGACLAAPNRLVFPALPPVGGDAGLAELLAERGFEPVSVIGMADDVERFERAAGLYPIVPVSYRLMALGPEDLAARFGLPGRSGRAHGSSPAAAPAAASSPAPAAAPDPAPAGAPGGGAFRVRRADPGDLEALYPLQEAYEREEVLTALHRFDPAGCRAALARSLAEQLLVAGELGRGGAAGGGESANGAMRDFVGGGLVAKAGTNARSFLLDQIGGVYVEPRRRGRGYGRAVMEGLLAELASAGRGAVLFVKPRNAAAMGLYAALGFVEIGDYRADYFAS
ncbi:MAG: GNAT family N-acetyltransferase [Spirochaetaceae bacterium]|nr:GNAT family N-acetyltransferase [Spirochaetaceae bacterium]